ncbi:SDR family oxidoreductase [Variovorax sp. J22R133]|uniref:SDR family oxidoreductase n=1 Tax=Variovorax brevis TaxID=3053503 RepID=UPI0025763458|nr:SDR family oxidoreductase [Variovorax sp. J22R133]MDM0111119.1 SDR family oxidoreductase [Variovorax sp. J22R133]
MNASPSIASSIQEMSTMIVQQLLPADLFKGKTVFVTGGGSGINLGVASNFAALGAHLAICGRSQERLDSAAGQLRALNQHVDGKVLAVAADVRDPAALGAAFERTGAQLGPIDVLVAGAAGNFICPAEELSPNGFRTVIDIDLMGAFHASRLGFGQLKKTRGCLIYISAAQASVPQVYQAHVGAAKAGIDIMMKNLAIEWGRHGIRANSVVPGPIAGTEGFKRLVSEDDAAELRDALPLRRHGSVDDIGQAAVFLASPLAQYITGTVLKVDGGLSLIGSALLNRQLEAMPRPARA